MADIHDEKIVNWRIDYLDDLEGFQYDNIVKAAPKKFRATNWAIKIGIATVITVFFSYLFASNHAWISGMFGNIAAGLIASLLILLYTTSKEKNLSFYDNLLLDLTKVLQRIDRTSNNLYMQHHELTCNLQLCTLDEYDFFITKEYMFQSTLLDIYERIKTADKLGYKGFTLTKEQIEEQINEFYALSNKVALAAYQEEKTNIGDFETEYHKFWSMEFEAKKQLHEYVSFIRDSAMIMRYGKASS